MTNIGPAISGQGGYALEVSKMRKLDIDPTQIRKIDPETAARLRQAEEARFTRPVNLQDHPSQKIYATVEVNGKTVATLYNSGAMMTSNADYARLANLPSIKDSQLTGPQLAQDRAEEIAKAVGGTIVKGADAMTPAAYRAVPPVQFELDQAGLDNWRAQIRSSIEAQQASAQTLVNAQIIGQTNPGAETASTTLSDTEADETTDRRRAAQDVIDEFLEFAVMSTEEKIRASILKSLNLTEEAIDAMPPEEQLKIEEKIAAIIREKITGKATENV